MKDKQLISFDINASFGFLKKPDTNEPMYLTYNQVHKPFVLGLLGAILGYKGFQKNKELPEYYQKLKHTLIGIQPINHEKGNFSKTVIDYNNGVGYASKETGGNLIITEQTLVSPSYRIYVLTDHPVLIQRIEDREAEYLPYLGKNDFSLWWDDVQHYDYDLFTPSDLYRISSLFIKRATLKDSLEEEDHLGFLSASDFSENSFVYFERLPIQYDEKLFQYEIKPFVFTTFKIKPSYTIDQLYKLNNDDVIQLF